MLVFNDGDILEDFISYQLRLLSSEDAGHGGPIYYHFIVLLIGCFPASIIMLRGIKGYKDDNHTQENFKRWMIILLCVVLVVFSIVNTKIVHYSSLAYFPITFLAAYAMHRISFKKRNWKISTTWLLGIFGTFWIIIFTGLPLLLMKADILIPRISDSFTKEILKTPVAWSGYEYIIGIFYLIALATAIFFFIKQRYLKGFTTLFGATAIVIFAFIPLIATKIEAYTQGAAIEFYESMNGKDVYIHILDIGNYKYGHLFYAKKPPELSSYFNTNIPKKNLKGWFLHGNIDRPVYFITKNTRADKYINIKGVEKYYEKNGFVFLRRMPVGNE